VLSRRPSLFGVSGEPVNIYSRLVGHTSAGEQYTFDMFDPTHYPWKAISPQGLDRTELSFFHYGEESALIGTKEVDDKEVWFLGGNLAYHAFLTRDELALSVLGEVLGLVPEELPERQEIPLVGYKADSSGYRFSINVPHHLEGSVLTIPVAYRHNMKVALNGEANLYSNKHNLVSIVAEPGQVFATLEPKVPVETAYGFGLSALALGAFYGTVFKRRRGAKHEAQRYLQSTSDPSG